MCPRLQRAFQNTLSDPDVLRLAILDAPAIAAQ